MPPHLATAPHPHTLPYSSAPQRATVHLLAIMLTSTAHPIKIESETQDLASMFTSVGQCAVCEVSFIIVTYAGEQRGI